MGKCCTTHGAWAFDSVVQRCISHGSWAFVTLHGPMGYGKKSLKGLGNWGLGEKVQTQMDLPWKGGYLFRQGEKNQNFCLVHSLLNFYMCTAVSSIWRQYKASRTTGDKWILQQWENSRFIHISCLPSTFAALPRFLIADPSACKHLESFWNVTQSFLSRHHFFILSRRTYYSGL